MSQPSRTWILTERVPRRCRLSTADVAYLLAEHRAYLELLPTPRRHVYRLTSAGRVGVIVAPDSRLVIRPKIPLANLFHLLDPSTPVPTQEDATSPVPGTEALEFLATRLVHLLKERVTAGLHRGYVERADHGPFLQGRLDLAAQVREPPGRKDRLHSRFEELTPDVPCNQVPRATAELLLRSSFLSEPVATALRNLLPHFDGVRPVPLTSARFTAAAPDRLTETYRPLLGLCRLLAENLAPGPTAGDVASPAFLLDLERVFERYVTVCVQEGFGGRPGEAVEVQPLRSVSEPVAGHPGLQMRPDVLVLRDGRPVLVVDAKWKRLKDGLPESPDLYQVLAYCTALAAGQAALVYPGRRNRVCAYRLANAPVRLDVFTLRVVGARDRCVAARHRLGRALRSLAAQD